jgi:DNA-binding transcriptional ArsR family regulator
MIERKTRDRWDGRQSFDRGLTILQLLAERGGLSATAIAVELGVTQSSATRLLQSLQKAGLVYKPHFRCFALDIGILRLAGMALDSFPIVKAAVSLCNRLHEQHGLGFTVATIDQARLVYLAHITEAPNAGLKMVDRSDFPLARSSLALSILHREGKSIFMKHITSDDAESLWARCESSVASHNFLYLTRFAGNRTNAAMPFVLQGRTYAAALFSKEQKIDNTSAKKLLTEMKSELDGVS